MSELIKITTKDGKQFVSAKELYDGLGLNRSEWSRWYKANIEKNNFFKENVDWTRFVITPKRGGKPITDFTISIEFAKHIINSAKTINSNVKINILKNLKLDDKIDLLARKEIEFLSKLEESISPFNLKGINQYTVLNYKIDYYIPDLNIAIEYDENDHRNYSYKAHEGRQKEIEKELGCRFIRISDKNSDEYNIGLVIKEMFNI